MSWCGYCLNTKPALPKLHGCPQSIRGQEQIAALKLKCWEVAVGGSPKPDSPEDDARRLYTRLTFDRLNEAPVNGNI